MYRDRAVSALSKVEALHEGMGELRENTRHLSALSEMKDVLLNSAIGKDHVPLRVFLIVLSSLCVVILGLVFILVFLLTGETTGWVNLFHR